MSIILYPYLNIPPEKNLVEVLDSAFTPIMVMDIDEARRRRLAYKAVAVALYNSKKKICVVRRAESRATFPGCWDLSAVDFVHATEAVEEAALRVLAETTGLDDIPLRFKASLQAAPGEPSSAGINLFMAGPAKAKPSLNPSLALESMFLDCDELSGLKETFPELLTPWLARVLEMSLMF